MANDRRRKAEEMKKEINSVVASLEQQLKEQLNLHKRGDLSVKAFCSSPPEVDVKDIEDKPKPGV